MMKIVMHNRTFDLVFRKYIVVVEAQLAECENNVPGCSINDLESLNRKGVEMQSVNADRCYICAVKRKTAGRIGRCQT